MLNSKKKWHIVTQSGTFEIYCLDESYIKSPKNYAGRIFRKIKQKL